jgi:DNA (cytosine-5)-methyltransferase 1
MGLWSRPKRERLITIGIRRDLTDKITCEFPKAHKYKPGLRDILKDVPASVGVPYGENKRRLFELVLPGGYCRDIDLKLAK